MQKQIINIGGYDTRGITIPQPPWGALEIDVERLESKPYLGISIAQRIKRPNTKLKIGELKQIIKEVAEDGEYRYD